MWYRLLHGETQYRDALTGQDSAHWEGLFGVIKSGRSPAHGGETDRSLQLFVMLWRLKTNKQNREKKFSWGMLNAHLERTLDLSVMIKEWYYPIWCSH